MNISKVIKLVKASLLIEDELTLSYLHGVKLKELQKILKIKPKYTGLFLQILHFFFSLIRSTSLTKRKINYDSHLLLFAGTQNQYESMLPTMIELNRRGISYNLVAPKSVCKTAIDCRLGLVEACGALYIFITHAYNLIFRLRKEKKIIELNNFASNYFGNYIYLTFFSSLLLNLKASHLLVVTSNDHNSSNRSLRVISELFKAKTLYMQHASVSNIFPPLQYDYALLDGRAAYNIYKSCIDNLPTSNRDYPVNVFLSGQKKNVRIQKEPVIKLFDIGVAVNSLDDFSCLKNFLNIASKFNLSILIRTHPRQEEVFLEKLKFLLKGNVQWCNPKKNDIRSYFSSIKCLVAANSSIHLEAALAGLPTLYYEFNGDTELTDYYGYVERGLTYPLNIKKMIDSIEKGTLYCNTQKRNVAVKMYSATYMTKWENKEDKLVVSLIEKILTGKCVDNIFQLSKEQGLYKLYEIVNYK